MLQAFGQEDGKGPSLLESNGPVFLGVPGKGHGTHAGLVWDSLHLTDYISRVPLGSVKAKLMPIHTKSLSLYIWEISKAKLEP